MATDSSKNMTPDIYDLANYVTQVKKDFNEGVSEDTLMISMYGMIGELFSKTMQNSVVMASEFANESIPTKAKFEKNIIAHALGLNINTLNATPARMEVFLTFIEDEIINTIGGGSGEFVFDCDNKIYFGDYEFHPDYDIIIKRIKLSNGSYTYTAMYDMNSDGVYPNPISDITNPYLTPPVVVKVNGTRYLFTSCLLRQVEKTDIYRKVLSDNVISSKTVNFEFDSQLAAFTVDVSNVSGDTHLIPIYEGLTSSNDKYPYIWYTYLDTNNIRIKFDQASFSPRVNSDVTIRLITTQGESGNFKWSSKEFPQFSFDSERLGYTNIMVQVRPITGESLYGTNKKSITELKRIIPVEALSRGSITTTTDLSNYFNAIDTDSSRIFFYKRKDNCFGRLYYSYILMKDASSNIIPTNTIDMIVRPSNLQADDSSVKLVLKRGQVLKLSADGNTAEIYDANSLQDLDYSDGFYYIIPYNFAICTNPMYGMYFLTTMNVNKNLMFTYINEECQYQYIATYLNINRAYLSDPDTYKITLRAEQNIADDGSMVIHDEETGKITGYNIKAFMTLYNKDGNPYRWCEASIIDYEAEANVFTFQFTMTSEDYIDSNNNIRIEGVNPIYNDGSQLHYGYLPDCSKAMIHIVTKQPEYSTNKIYTDIDGNTDVDISSQIPTIQDDWCITNSYEVINGIDFFFNYSEIVYSNIEAIQDETSEEGYYYRVSNVPMIKHNYFKTEDMVEYFCGELVRRKQYIQEAIKVLEDSFGMDFKFFNTYGPSKLFTLDNETKYLNRVNLSFIFKLALQTNYDENIITYIMDDIKEFVNNINNIDSLHMSNLVSTIEKKYGESIKYFEFVDMNGYGPGEQHLFAMQMPDNVITPELVNINTLEDGTPDITIVIA